MRTWRLSFSLLVAPPQCSLTALHIHSLFPNILLFICGLLLCAHIYPDLTISKRLYTYLFVIGTCCDIRLKLKFQFPLFKCPARLQTEFLPGALSAF